MTARQLPQDDAPLILRLFSADEQPPAAADQTLCGVYEQHLRPRLIAAGKSPRTITEYDCSLGYWRQLTCDPPVNLIDDSLLDRFAGKLWELPGRKAPTIGSYTVIRHVTNVNAVLRLLGPKSVANKRGRGLLADPPMMERPTKPQEPPADDYTTGELRQLLSVTHSMERPREADWEPKAFWDAVLLTLAYAGFRRKTLFWLDAHNLVDGYFIVRPGQIKQQRGFKQYCHPLAQAAIERMGVKPGGPLFRWPHFRDKEGSRGWFNEQFNRLCEQGGLPQLRHFGTKGFRKWHASEMAAINPLAAQLSLNHAGGGGVIGQHYVNHRLVKQTMLKLPTLVDEPTGDDARQGRLF